MKRIKIIIKKDVIILPINYQYIIQGFIYKLIEDDNYSKYIHDEKTINKFNFSLLYGKHKIVDKNIIFYNSLEFYLSSYEDELIEIIKNNDNLDNIHLFEQKIDSISFIDDNIIVDKDEIKIMTLSPISIHDTKDKKTIYFKPTDQNYIELLNYNYCHKLGIDNMILFWIKDFKRIKKNISKYKNFIIESYSYEATITGDKTHLNNLLYLGLGDKNSIGYGMIKIK